MPTSEYCLEKEYNELLEPSALRSENESCLEMSVNGGKQESIRPYSCTIT